MANEKPINADVPVTEPTDAPPKAARAGTPGKRPVARSRSPLQRRRRSAPAGAIAVGALIALALALIAAAILGGRASDEGGATVTSSRQSAPAQAEYPRLATSNTTRIEGADPTSRAAAAALAAYPATDEAQRPNAVSLADPDDWRSAIAASVLMAAPVGAPPLISGTGEVPEVTSEAVAGLDPTGARATGGVQAFAIGEAAVPEGLRERRIRATGIAAAAAIAGLREDLVGEAPKHVIVAPARSPAFAMPAAAWAARSGDPVLFTASARLSRPTAQALKGLNRTPVYVLGPSSVISSRVVREIAKTGLTVRRVSGENPVESSLALARYADGDFGWNLNDPGHGFVVARSNSPLDAAGASPLSASGTWGALLLTNRGDTLPTALRGYLLDVKPGYTTNPTRAFYNHVWVIGDQEAISVSQQAQIDSLAALAKIGGKS